MIFKNYFQRRKDIRNEKTIMKIYQEIVETVPDLEKEEIELIFERKSYFHSPFSIDTPFYTPTGLYINIDEAPNLPIEWQKAGIVHELGHFKRLRKYSKTELETSLRRYMLIAEHGEEGFLEPDEFSELDKKEQHRIKRLKQHSLLHEIYADNEVINVGLGKPFIKLLDWGYETQPLSVFGKEEVKARIKNLEARLGETAG